jgi:hypothetical protein
MAQFQEVTAAAGIVHVGESYGASWGDLNGDNWPDLFVNNHRTFPGLYRNNGDGTFTNIARQADVSGTWRNQPQSDQHGATWADFDNDGDQDLFVSTGARWDSQFFVNQGGVLVDRTTDFGVQVDFEGRMPIWFDYNGDSWLDVAMMNGRRNSLWRQQPNAPFLDETLVRGFSCLKTSYAQLMDFNHNGLLDFACAHDGRFPKAIYELAPTPFLDITGVMEPIGIAIDTAIADFNHDLLPDIFAVRGNLRPTQALEVAPGRIEAQLAVGPNGTNGGAEQGFSFQTAGDLMVEIDSKQVSGQFKVFIGAAGIHPNGYPSFTLSPADPNTIGISPHTPGEEPRLFIGFDPAALTWTVLMSTGPGSTRGYITLQSTAPIANLTPLGLRPGDLPVTPMLYMNTGNVLMPYTDQTGPAGLGIPLSCVSTVAGDFDNDRDVDIYAVCRGGVENLPDRLFLNNGNGTFVEIPGAAGAAGVVGAGLASGAGTGENVVVADYDGDGFLDLFVTNGLNMQPLKVGGPDQLFRNVSRAVGNPNNWIQFDLVGTLSNRDAVGARVYLIGTPDGITPDGIPQFRLQDGGYHRVAQNFKRIHFGLGLNAGAFVQIVWPSGRVSPVFALPANQIWRIREDDFVEPVVLGAVTPLPPAQPGDECGKPLYDRNTEAAMFVWKDCDTGLWHLRGTAGGSPVLLIYDGNIISNQAIGAIPVSLEPSDLLDGSTPGLMLYRLNVENGAEDGFEFAYGVGPGAIACLTVGAPAGVRLMVGARTLPAPNPLNLNTLGGC